MAKEYIEREAVKRELLSWAACMNHPEYLIKDDALHIIDSMPAADVAEVVRCRSASIGVMKMVNCSVQMGCYSRDAKCTTI